MSQLRFTAWSCIAFALIVLTQLAFAFPMLIPARLLVITPGSSSPPL